MLAVAYIAVVLVTVSDVISMPMPTVAPDMGMDMGDIEEYFMNYHYMGPNLPDPQIADLFNSNVSVAIRTATEMFQRRYSEYGLQVTGELDVATLSLMQMPRCAMPDIYKVEDMMLGATSQNRKKRFLASGLKWEKELLTYRISIYTPDLPPGEVDREIRRAFDVWQDASYLTFIEFNPVIHDVLDIDIQFVEPYIDHGDGYPFYKDSGVLAHAFFPGEVEIAGDAHFNEGEIWTIGTDSGINLFQVAAHEFGHSLGLGHSTHSSALMAPFYMGYTPNFTLANDDVMGIQHVYGERKTITKPPRPTTTTSTTTTTTTTTTTPATTTTITQTTPPFIPSKPDMCRSPRFDAVTTIKTSFGYKTYGFQGKYYFLLDDDNGIANSYPRLIKDGWKGIPDNIDAALFWDEIYDRRSARHLPATTFIFQGNLYWRVEDMRVVAGPYPISQWGVPSYIDAAFVWKRNGKTYFFKGDQYWRYTEGSGIDPDYPRQISVWRGLPTTGVDAAMQHSDGKTYFFKGKHYYYFNDKHVRVTYGYPKDTADKWFHCNTNYRHQHEHEHANLP